jgi:hypothetical protein
MLCVLECFLVHNSSRRKYKVCAFFYCRIKGNCTFSLDFSVLGNISTARNNHVYKCAFVSTDLMGVFCRVYKKLASKYLYIVFY